MLGTLTDLRIALQAVVQLMQQLTDPHPRRLMPSRSQRVSQIPGRLGRPPQLRTRITPTGRTDQRLQRVDQPGIGLYQPFTPTPGGPGPPRLDRRPIQLGKAPVHRRPRQPRRPRHRRHPTPTNRSNLRRYRQPPLSLIEMRQQPRELRGEHRLNIRIGHTYTQPHNSAL
jgi:hypothetical protein